MSVKSRSPKIDKAERRVLRAFEAYHDDHPAAEAVTYRQNSVSIRVRVVDPSFKGMDRVAREEAVAPVLDGLPDEVQADITQLLLLAPDEVKTSFANREFEHPVPSRI